MPRLTAGTRLTATNRPVLQDGTASLYMDGNAGYLTLPITPAPTGFNFGMWIKTAKRTTASSTIYMSSNSAAFTNGFIFSRAAGRGDIEFIGYNSTNSVNTSLRSGQVSDGRWVHLAVTYLPSGVCNMYQDGVLVNTVTATNTIITGTTSIYVGRRSYTAAFAGLNASQLVWHNTTTPWTAAQVLALYQNGTIPTGATAVYPLNEGGGTVAYDTSGNGNNGTITSGTWREDAPSKNRKAVNNNLVYNGDFEIVPPSATNVATTSGDKLINGTSSGADPNQDNIFGWMFWNYTGSYAAKFDTTIKHGGTASMKISTTATASTAGVRCGLSGYTNYRRRIIPILPSTSYTYSVWIKTQANSGSATTGARFQFAQVQGDLSASNTITVVTGLNSTQDWTRYTGTFTSSSSARYAVPSMQIVGDDGTGTLIMDAWFDDIELYPTTAITRSAVT